jgi:hypothetical protein
MTHPFRQWLSEQHGRQCVANMIKNGFDAHWAEDIDAARQLILPKIRQFNSFGFGGSETTRQLGLVEDLTALGKTVYDHWQSNLSSQQSYDIRRHQLQCDCFFCSANAISLTGEIVNVDGAGNRTSAMGFGPSKVIIVAGMNKICADLPGALRRIREVAGPMRAKSMGLKTPCAQTGICSDCNSPQRICRITTILHRQPMLTPTSVILINQTLGY